MTIREEQAQGAGKFKKTSIGELLKYWRIRSDFSQLDLALDCETSSRHLSFVETGRAHPSRELLLRLVRVLNLPLRARNMLLISAGYAPLYQETGLTEPEMIQIRSMLGNLVSMNDRYPSMLIDRHWNILQSNLAFDRMCEEFVTNPDLLELRPRNLLRIFLNPHCLGNAVVNFPEVYETMLNRLRRFIHIMGNDEEGKNLVDEISAFRPKNSPAISQDLPHLVMPLRLSKDNKQLSLFTMVATMGAPLNITLQEIHLEFGLPMDPASEAFLDELIS